MFGMSFYLKLKTILSSDVFGFGNENGVSVSSVKNIEIILVLCNVKLNWVKGLRSNSDDFINLNSLEFGSYKKCGGK